MQQLGQMDAMFLFSERPRTPMHIGSLHVYDASQTGGSSTFEDIIEHVRSRLPLTRILRRKIVHVPMNLDYPYWVEDVDFDLEFHVRQIALPAPGDWAQLWRQTSRLHSQPLDLTRPPWEIFIIEGLDPATFGPDRFGLLIKIHHAAIDGIAGIELMNALNDLEAGGREPVVDAWQGEPNPSQLALLTRAGRTMALTPVRATRLLARSITNLPKMGSELRRPSFGSAPTTSLNAVVTTNRIADGFRFELATAKRIRTAVPGATVNDVILTIVGGGLRSYLQERGELPEQSLTAGVPISLRDPADAGEGGNQISMMVVPLGTDIADPIERLRVVQQATAETKERSTAVGARTLAEGGELLPGALIGAAARAMHQLGGRVAAMIGNVCVTNVPGSQVPLHLRGARMEAYYGIGPVYDHAGPIHTIVSYLGNLHISAATCREIVPDIRHYTECIEAAFRDLERATTADDGGAPTKRRRAGSSRAGAKPRAATRATGTATATRKR